MTNCEKNELYQRKQLKCYQQKSNFHCIPYNQKYHEEEDFSFVKEVDTYICKMVVDWSECTHALSISQATTTHRQEVQFNINVW